MKRVIPAALLAITAVPALAADDKTAWEIGAAAVFGNYSWDDSSVDDSSTGGKLFGGYRFNRWFGVEGAYHKFGDFEADLLPAQDGGDNNVEVDGFSLAGVLFIPVPVDNLEPFLKAGFYDFDQQRVVDDLVVDSNSPSGFMAGGGADLVVTDKLRFRLEADWFDIDDADLWSLNLGLSYLFGRPAAPVVAAAAPPPPPPAAAPPPPPPPVPVDSDGDGVVDGVDQCPGTPAGAKVDAQGCETELTLKGVTFALNSATLTGQDQLLLNSVASILQQRPQFNVEIVGHTDSTGSDALNQDLSERRAAAVRDYLVGQGIPAERLTSRGAGESEPIADNDTAEGRALNRRVTLNFSGRPAQ
ncbi:MAG: OmpA family protein [Chromatiales bacterium]|jgi:OOP family OmpA-OmpF porin|nr:OmpA family protein [Chromatiales bacterium]